MEKNKWIELIKLDHDSNAGQVGYSLVIGNPLTQENLGVAEKELFGSFPSELVSIYGACDGYGARWLNEKMYWILIPFKELPEFINSVRDWFCTTHPSVASRFLPFFNFGSGDYIGFLTNEQGVLLGLYEFSHELYEFSADQDWKEFLVFECKTISEYLNTRSQTN